MKHIIGPLDVQVVWTVGHKPSTTDASKQFTALTPTHYIYAADGRLLSAFDSSLGVMYASPRNPPAEVLAEWPTR